MAGAVVEILNDLASEIHLNAREKGFYDNPRNFGELISLCHSELSEALEEKRNGTDLLPDPATGESRLAVELADVIIRVLDIGVYEGVDIGSAVVAKMAYNSTRPHKHGGKKF